MLFKGTLDSVFTRRGNASVDLTGTKTNVFVSTKKKNYRAVYYLICLSLAEGAVSSGTR